MSSAWLEMSLAVPGEAVELASQILVGLGCAGVTAAERSLDTFTVPDPESLASDPLVRAYFTWPDNPAALCEEVKKALAPYAGIHPEFARIEPTYRRLEDDDWASNWQQHFPPFRVGGRLVIHPSWIDWEAKDDEVVLTLDPGQAFGTGTHATTGLCLEALARCFEVASPPHEILDVGTGSGILAMAAAALGARRVLACDIDVEACRVAEENVRLNRLDGQVVITPLQLEQIPGSFELVLANILASENIRLGRALVDHLKPGGHLVLSGILIEQEQQVIDAFAAYPLTLLATDHRDEWTCIVYQRHE